MRGSSGALLCAALAACGGGDDGSTAYRVDTLALRDPHVFALDGSLDATEAMNMQLRTSITEDGDRDGLLDLSLVVVFRPLNLAAESTLSDWIAGAECSAPITSPRCTAGTATLVESTISNSDAGCLTAMAGTLGGYQPPPTEPAGPCFVTDPEVFTLEVGEVDLVLSDAIHAADYGATGSPDRLENGLLIGFMSQATADATILPEDTPLVGGEALSALLLDEDKDVGPGGADGWWFFLNFEASRVEYAD